MSNWLLRFVFVLFTILAGSAAIAKDLPKEEQMIVRIAEIQVSVPARGIPQAGKNRRSRVRVERAGCDRDFSDGREAKPGTNPNCGNL